MSDNELPMPSVASDDELPMPSVASDEEEGLQNAISTCIVVQLSKNEISSQLCQDDTTCQRYTKPHSTTDIITVFVLISSVMGHLFLLPGHIKGV
jgi:hypothetical protein